MKEKSIKPLVSAMETNSGLVQRYAAGMLGHVQDQEAVEPLLMALHSANRGVQLQAAKSLVKIGEIAAPAMIHALEDNDPTVWQLASAILVKIGQPAIRHLLDALPEKTEAAQILNIEIIGQIGDAKTVFSGKSGNSNMGTNHYLGYDMRYCSTCSY
jgi:HEAT repeat protein